MNKFAGTVVLEGIKNIVGLEFEYIENLSKTGDKVLYIYGETDYKNIIEFIDFLISKLGNLKDHDISFETENKIEFTNHDYEEGIYELATFEGEFVDFNEINERFSDIVDVMSIRENGISNKFGNKVIKVDFVY